ncbi:MAG: Fe-S cluster assembly protein SufD, partial [Myxococcota bacterium]
LPVDPRRDRGRLGLNEVNIVEPEHTFLVEQFDGASRPGDGEWIHALRQRAIEDFARLGFPTQKSESYRYTNVGPIAKAKLSPRQRAGSVDALPVAPLDTVGVVAFVDGAWNPGLSNLDGLPDGVRVRSLREELASDANSLQDRLSVLASPGRDGFHALNTAFASDGLIVEVPAGLAVEKPLRVVHVTTDASSGTAGHLRQVVQLGKAAELKIVEEWVSLCEGTYFNSVVREVFLDDGAHLGWVELIRESEQGYHIGSLVTQVPRDARLSQFGLTLSGALVRREAHVELSGESADAQLSGIYLPTGQEVHDQLTFVDHAVPRCTSNQLYKGVLDDKSRGVFNGKVLVRPDAQQTLAYQQNRSLVLSDNATADTRPQLEIYADDVKCSHGATMGQLDDDALFYLRQRGISQGEAQRLLMQAFVGEVFELLPESDVRTWIAAEAVKGLPGARP